MCYLSFNFLIGIKKTVRVPDMNNMRVHQYNGYMFQNLSLLNIKNVNKYNFDSILNVCVKTVCETPLSHE